MENRAQMGYERITTGWRASCECGAATVQATRAGPLRRNAGTVGFVAERLQRDTIQVESSETYAEMAETLPSVPAHRCSTDVRSCSRRGRRGILVVPQRSALQLFGLGSSHPDRVSARAYAGDEPIKTHPIRRYEY